MGYCGFLELWVYEWKNFGFGILYILIIKFILFYLLVVICFCLVVIGVLFIKFYLYGLYCYMYCVIICNLRIMNILFGECYYIFIWIFKYNFFMKYWSVVYGCICFLLNFFCYELLLVNLMFLVFYLDMVWWFMCLFVEGKYFFVVKCFCKLKLRFFGWV